MVEILIGILGIAWTILLIGLSMDKTDEQRKNWDDIRFEKMRHDFNPEFPGANYFIKEKEIKK